MRNFMMIFSLSVFLSAAPSNGERTTEEPGKIENTTKTSSSNSSLTGKASYYGAKFHGKRTASGEAYNMNGFSAAHKTLRFGTQVKITNVSNGKSVTVTVNDRGPYTPSRQFDLSDAAFHQIASKGTGVINIQYEIIE